MTAPTPQAGGWVERAMELAQDYRQAGIGLNDAGYSRAELREHLEAQAAITERLRYALELAIRSHGFALMSDPPQDAWKANKVQEVARDALLAYTSHQKGTA